MFGRHDTDSVAAFLHRLSEEQEFSDSVFLVDGYDYQSNGSTIFQNIQLDYVSEIRVRHCLVKPA
ncbi:hypothetical protein GL213_03465 [Halogeometricum borinquense]|nr:hypothetical protein GL213_03465 [Halogeometricum borinquense]